GDVVRIPLRWLAREQRSQRQLEDTMRITIPLALACAGLALLPSVAPAQTVTFNSISLTWTAPGDDSLTGTASQYDLRYSTSPITASNFSSATRWTSTPVPTASGTTQGVTVDGLTPATT